MHATRTYSGSHAPDGSTIVLVSDIGARDSLPLRRDLIDRADHFDWGRDTSGASQLALALLADAVDDSTALLLADSFKRAVILSLPRHSWTLTHDNVCSVVKLLPNIVGLPGPQPGRPR